MIAETQRLVASNAGHEVEKLELQKQMLHSVEGDGRSADGNATGVFGAGQEELALAAKNERTKA